MIRGGDFKLLKCHVVAAKSGHSSPGRNTRMFPKTKREFVNLSSAELQGHRSGKLEFREAWREPDISFNTAGTTMAYRISYEDGSAITTGAQGYGGVTRSEYFRSEFEALKSAPAAR